MNACILPVLLASMLVPLQASQTSRILEIVAGEDSLIGLSQVSDDTYTIWRYSIAARKLESWECDTRRRPFIHAGSTPGYVVWHCLVTGRFGDGISYFRYSDESRSVQRLDGLGFEARDVVPPKPRDLRDLVGTLARPFLSEPIISDRYYGVHLFMSDYADLVAVIPPARGLLVERPAANGVDREYVLLDPHTLEEKGAVPIPWNGTVGRGEPHLFPRGASRPFGMADNLLVVSESDLTDSDRSYLRLLTIEPFEQVSRMSLEERPSTGRFARFHWSFPGCNNTEIVLHFSEPLSLKTFSYDAAAPSRPPQVKPLMDLAPLIEQRQGPIVLREGLVYLGVPERNCIRIAPLDSEDSTEAIEIPSPGERDTSRFDVAPDGHVLVTYDGTARFRVWRVDFPHVELISECRLMRSDQSNGLRVEITQTGETKR